jgi:hypothetical protein
LYNNTKLDTIEDYLNNVFMFIIFIDLTSPVANNINSTFFTGLVTNAARAYYPTLLNVYPNRESRFPELFYTAGNQNLKKLVNEYIDSYIYYWTNAVLVGLYNNLTNNMAPLDKYSFAKMSDLESQIIPNNNLTLKSVCENKSDIESIPDS